VIAEPLAEASNDAQCGPNGKTATTKGAGLIQVEILCRSSGNISGTCPYKGSLLHLKLATVFLLFYRRSAILGRVSARVGVTIVIPISIEPTPSAHSTHLDTAPIDTSVSTQFMR